MKIWEGKVKIINRKVREQKASAEESRKHRKKTYKITLLISSVGFEKFNVNPFVFAHKYAGSVARLSDQSVINVSAGGGLVPVVNYETL